MDAKELVDALSKASSPFERERREALITALATEHPTLLGQVAKAVATAIMWRVTGSDEWRPYDPTYTEREGPCPLNTAIAHAHHDGRFDCTTVIGAEMMARQSFI